MEQSDLLAIVIDALEQLGIAYLVAGSQASNVWGEPRFTNGIDIVVQFRLEHLSSFCAAFPKGTFI